MEGEMEKKATYMNRVMERKTIPTERKATQMKGKATQTEGEREK